MSERVVQINVAAGPESLVIDKDARYELIAQVARALQERRQAVREEFDMDWEGEDLVFDFSRATMDFN